MSASIGIQGTVTSWTAYAGLLSSWTCPYRFNLNINQSPQDATCFQGTTPGAKKHIASIYEWDGTIEANFPNPAKLGKDALVTYAAGYDYNDSTITAYDLELMWAVLETSGFASGGTVAKSFVPGEFEWGGSYSALVDTTNPISNVSAAGITGTTATFKMTEDGATDTELTGDIQTSVASVSVDRPGLNAVNYTFKGTLSPVATGAVLKAATNGIFDASTGVLLHPTASELTLQAVTGRTYVGSAFPTRIRWQFSPATVNKITIDFKGTSTLAIN